MAIVLFRFANHLHQRYPMLREHIFELIVHSAHSMGILLSKAFSALKLTIIDDAEISLLESLEDLIGI